MYSNFYFRNQIKTYTVQKGDSLYSIAKKFNTTVNNLISLNHLTNTILQIGQSLIIEDNSSQNLNHIGSDICDTYEYKETTSEPIYDIYIVKKNDNLYSIAKKFNTTIANLIYLNNLKNNVLTINQQLKVPHSIEYITYYVKKGDSLYKIASNYGVTPKQIIDLNQLTTTTILIGQPLKIPVATSTINNIKNIHIVAKGETLYSIAKNYNTTVDKIKKENNLTSNILNIGQKIIIPS